MKWFLLFLVLFGVTFAGAHLFLNSKKLDTQVVESDLVDERPLETESETDGHEAEEVELVLEHDQTDSSEEEDTSETLMEDSMTSEPMETTEATKEEPEATTPEVSLGANAISAAQWEHTAQTEKILNMPGSGPGTQQIVGAVVWGPSREEGAVEGDLTYYFATQSAIYLPPPADTGDLYLAIYAYDLKTYTWERLRRYEASYDFDNPEPGDVWAWHLVGYEDGKLILKTVGTEDATDGQLRTLDLSAPSGAFAPYTANN